MLCRKPVLKRIGSDPSGHGRRTRSHFESSRTPRCDCGGSRAFDHPWSLHSPRRRISRSSASRFSSHSGQARPRSRLSVSSRSDNIDQRGLWAELGIQYSSRLADRITSHGPMGNHILEILAGICAIAARNDAQDNRMLGWSSRLASNSLSALKAKYPVLPSNTTIYFSNAGEPGLSWDTSDGELFKIAYGDESIRTLYWDWGVVITKELLERGPLIVMKYDQFHFTDVTKEFLAASVQPVNYQPRTDYKLAITPDVAKRGEKYWLSIAGIEDSDVTLHYSVDGSPVRAVTAHFDNHHQASFDVSDQTHKGLYKFVGFRKAGTEDWIQAAASIRID